MAAVHKADVGHEPLQKPRSSFDRSLRQITVMLLFNIVLNAIMLGMAITLYILDVRHAITWH